MKFYREQETVPCRFCGKSTNMTGTKLCDRCWELERRISSNMNLAEKILQSAKKEQP